MVCHYKHRLLELEPPPASLVGGFAISLKSLVRLLASRPIARLRLKLRRSESGVLLRTFEACYFPNLSTKGIRG